MKFESHFVWGKVMITSFCLMMGVLAVFGQTKTRKLPRSINHPAINVSTPFISFDGDALVFLSDNSDDFQLVPVFTYRERKGDWKDPQPFPATIFNKVCYQYGYTLGPSSKDLNFSSAKAPTVGGYDIWVSNRTGASWGIPKNVGAPINSRSNEASASYSPDGKVLYFMRCDKMNQKSATGCKIMKTTMKSNGTWEEPEELPEAINKGNSQHPRIMADGEALIFSTDQHGGKGGMDLFITYLRNGSWTVPQPLDFVNTEKDDQFVTANALGRYLIKTTPGERRTELVEYLFPESLRPKGIMRIDGQLNNPDQVQAYISVIDQSTGDRVFSGRPQANNSFKIFLKEGAKYDLSIDAAESNVSFYLTEFDLTQEDIPPFENIHPTIKKVAIGDEFEMDRVTFAPRSATLNPSSHQYLEKMVRMMKGAYGLKLELQVLLYGYQEDSIRSSPDLTERVLDSIKITIDDIDSLGQLYQRDSVYTRITYHNNRTEKQAEAIINFLVKEGLDRSLIVPFVNARPEAILNNRKTVIKARIIH